MEEEWQKWNLQGNMEETVKQHLTVMSGQPMKILPSKNMEDSFTFLGRSIQESRKGDHPTPGQQGQAETWWWWDDQDTFLATAGPRICRLLPLVPLSPHSIMVPGTLATVPSPCWSPLLCHPAHLSRQGEGGSHWLAVCPRCFHKAEGSWYQCRVLPWWRTCETTSWRLDCRGFLKAVCWSSTTNLLCVSPWGQPRHTTLGSICWSHGGRSPSEDFLTVFFLSDPVDIHCTLSPLCHKLSPLSQIQYYLHPCWCWGIEWLHGILSCHPPKGSLAW